MKLIKTFEKFNLNESFRDNMKDKSLEYMMNHKSSYKDGVACSLIEIITTERDISEKSFKLYDDVMKEVENFYESNQDKLKDFINDCEVNNYRKQYCAEKLYIDYFGDKLNEKRNVLL